MSFEGPANLAFPTGRRPRVLMVHNRYLIRAGEDASTDAEVRALREYGWEVDLYEEDNARIAELGGLRTGLRAIWSRESYREVSHRLRRQPYDVVHVQNFFPLISPAAHYAARRAGVPVVQSLRNYRLLCAASTLHRDGKICGDCVGKMLPWPAVRHGCYRGSKPATASIATMLTVHRAARTWHRCVDSYIALSKFARDQFILNGFDADKIAVKPNFVLPDPGIGPGDGRYALFVGRLAPEKGLGTLLDAWQRIGERLPLKIVGDGPLAAEVAARARAIPGVSICGALPLPRVYELMGRASLQLVTSEWYEPFGRVVVEAFAKGTPVIASEIGAMAELVDHGQNGLRYKAGSPDGLSRQVFNWLSHPDMHANMRRAARAAFEARFTADQNAKQLDAIYRRAAVNSASRANHVRREYVAAVKLPLKS